MNVDALDEALGRFAATGPEFGGGLSNHGPMGAEALVALGRADAVLPWAEYYSTRLQSHPSQRNRIEPKNWREALGDIERVGDWEAFFLREMDAVPWRQTLETWVQRLAPGIMAAATHGVIRTGHAVRSLERGENPERLHELGAALAYWAARYQELPVASGRIPSQLRVQEAIGAVELVSAAKRGQGLIFDVVKALDPEQFGPVIDYVSVDVDPGAFVSELTHSFVRHYLANAGTAAIPFIHSVTAPAALRTLAPHLTPGTTLSAMRYTWQACASLYATYADPRARIQAFDDEQTGDVEDLIDQAVASRDEHAMKFTEACLREDRIAPDAAFIAASRDVVHRLRRRD